MRRSLAAVRALALSSALLALPLGAARAQGNAASGGSASAGAEGAVTIRDCAQDVTRRQIKGQAATDYLAECRAGRVTRASIQRSCEAAASQDRLQGQARTNFIAACTKGPD